MALGRGCSLARAGSATRELLALAGDVELEAFRAMGIPAVEIARHGGGSGANAACAASRAGADAGFVGVVGDDEEGRLVERDFRAFGVATGGLAFRSGGTPRSVILTRADLKEPRQYTVRPAQARCDGDASLPECEVIHLSHPGRRRVAWACEQRERGRRVSVDLGPAWTRYGDAARVWDLLEQADLVVLNSTHLPAIARTLDAGDLAAPEAAREIRARLPACRLLVTTFGPKGALAMWGVGAEVRWTVWLTPPSVACADVTGAGDCLAGHLLAALAIGELDDPRAARDAVRCAVAASALSVTRLSARGYLPDRSEAERNAKLVSVSTT